MELIATGTKFDFLGKRYLAFTFSLALIVGTIFSWIQLGDRKFGIDFLGGNDIVVDIQGQTTAEELQQLLAANGMENAIAQAFEAASNDYSLRVSGLTPAEAKEKVSAALNTKFAGKFEILQTEYVGPVVGEELREKALIAITVSLVMILLYVSIRFEFAYALGAVVALFHDVIVATGVYLWAGHELNMASLAAALTIVGYSVNDTIVIFDRLREEVARKGTKDLVGVMNEVMNAMLGRTIITSLLTFFSALALLVFGGGAISDLSVYLVAGIIAGSYSTIYIASPVVLLWHNYRASRVR